MKPGTTVYYFDSEGAPQKGNIGLKKTNIVESVDGKKTTIKYTIDGKAGEYDALDFYENKEEILAEIDSKLA